METEALARWIEAYEHAWTSNAPADIRALFTEHARYHTAPFREPWVGHEGIVAGWLDRLDDPSEWSFRWEVLATAEDVGFVRGWIDYSDGERYHNLWVIELDPDGRCSSFTEWWMEESADEEP